MVGNMALVVVEKERVEGRSCRPGVVLLLESRCKSDGGESGCAGFRLVRASAT